MLAPESKQADQDIAQGNRAPGHPQRVTEKGVIIDIHSGAIGFLETPRAQWLSSIASRRPDLPPL